MRTCVLWTSSSTPPLAGSLTAADPTFAVRAPSICHGPTLFAALQVNVNGKKQSGATGRKEPQISFDLHTQRDMKDAGGRPNVAADVAKRHGVVEARHEALGARRTSGVHFIRAGTSARLQLQSLGDSLSGRRAAAPS